jgi:hypothetical protein
VRARTNVQWCIVELFVYDQMWPADDGAAAPEPARGGARALDDGELGKAPTANKVTMMQLPGLLAEQFATFDAAQAKSAAQADYERLLQCVELGCGSVDSFNVRARLLLASATQFELTQGGGLKAGDAAGVDLARRQSFAPTRRRSWPWAFGGAARDDGEADGPSFGRTHFGALVWLWARVLALAVALLSALGASVIYPALADCARGGREAAAVAAPHATSGGLG